DISLSLSVLPSASSTTHGPGPGFRASDEHAKYCNAPTEAPECLTHAQLRERPAELRKLAGTFDLASVYRRALGQANLLSQLNDLTPLLDCFRARRPKRAARSSPSFVRPRPRATFDPQILSAGARGWVKTGRRPRLDVIEHAGHALMVGVDSRAGRRFPF